MSMVTALYSSASALSNYGNAMGVIGNNLSNNATTAFKGSSTSFTDILAQAVGSTPSQGTNQLGNGVSMSAISKNMEQGSFQYTGVVTDMAVDGDGFFVVKDYSNSEEHGASFFTRAGDFVMDKDGDLVTKGGLRLQGVELTSDSEPVGSPKDVSIGSVKSSSQPTSVAKVSVNLDSSASAPSGAYDPVDPSTYNFSTSVRVYDSLGNGHVVELHFIKTADNTWTWHPVVTSSEMSSGYANTDALSAVDLYVPIAPAATAGTIPVETTALGGEAYALTAHPTTGDLCVGQLVFTPSGALKTEGSRPITFNWGQGADPQEILFDFGDALGATAADNADSTDDYIDYERDVNSANYLQFVGRAAKTESRFQTGTEGSVQFAAGFATLKLEQDGFPAGYMERLSVDAEGKIFGSFSNGQVKPLYQLVLANFPNPNALDLVGHNLFAETWTSGQALQGYPTSGGFGSVVSQSLEQSNVDMSEEFVKMISIQRAFQANSRIVSVTDGMLEELINLKR